MVNAAGRTQPQTEGEEHTWQEATEDFLGTAPGTPQVVEESITMDAPPAAPDGRPSDDPTALLLESDSSQQEQQEQQQQEQQTDTDTSSILEQLRAKMKEQGIQEPEPEPEPSPVDDYEKRIESVQDYDKFEETFETVMGVKPKEALQQYTDLVTTVKSLTDELQRSYNEMSLERQEMRLRQAWGQNFDSNLEAVKKVYATLPPQMQQALSDDRGALLLWQTIQGQQNGAVAPAYIQGRATSGNPRWKYSDFLKMSDKEYYSQEVQEALSSGNFIDDR